MATSINFPTSPTLGQTYTYGTSVWTWNGSTWSLFSRADNYGNPIVGSLTATTGITTNNITINGVGSVVTAPLGTNTNQIANTAFVLSNSISYNYVIKINNYTAVAKDGLFCDTSTASFTVTLPAFPNDNDMIFIADATGYFNARPLTISGNGKQIMGDSGDLIVDVKNTSFTLIYKTGLNWRII